MAKGVDGVYDADPKTNPDAVRFDALEYDEVLAQGPQGRRRDRDQPVQDNDLPIVVFDLLEQGNIARAVHGEKIGTMVVRRPPLTSRAHPRLHRTRKELTVIDETLLEGRGEDGQGRHRRQGRLRRDPHRPGPPRDVLQDRRRLLRLADPVQPAGRASPFPTPGWP